MRPIDADALYDKAETWYKNAPTPYRKIYRSFVDIIADAPTIALPPNDPLTLDELREIDRNHVIAYLPGEKVYDRFGTPWIIESAEIQWIRGELKQIFHCGHPGTEDYHAMYEDEIYTSPYRRKLEEGTI